MDAKLESELPASDPFLQPMIQSTRLYPFIKYSGQWYK